MTEEPQRASEKPKEVLKTAIISNATVIMVTLTVNFRPFVVARRSLKKKWTSYWIICDKQANSFILIQQVTYVSCAKHGKRDF